MGMLKSMMAQEKERVGVKFFFYLNNIKDLVPSDDPILREEMPEFDFLEPPIDPIELAHVLSQNCLYHDGLGLSAPQIGLRYRACVVKSNPMICMINPMILAEGEEVYAEEGYIPT